MKADFTVKPRVGILQGRLSPRPARRFQAFPRATWRQEFELAARLGFECIEWLYEIDDHTENPLMTSTGRHEIRNLIRQSGVVVSSVCGDFFMECRLAGGSAARRAEAAARLKELLPLVREVGARRILLPLLEQAHVDTPELKDQVVESIQQCLPELERSEVELGLEMEIAGPDYHALIERIGHPLVGAYYDTGNSTAQGLCIATDALHVIDELLAVHVKDRRIGGSSQPLGTGDADFVGFFAALVKADFSGELVCQHYYGPSPKDDAARSLEFVQQMLAQARLEAA